jgi:hypothetical protein
MAMASVAHRRHPFCRPVGAPAPLLGLTFFPGEHQP